MSEEKNFFKNITEDRVESFCLWSIITGLVAVVYSIVAGIWGFAPIERMNVKIFGTAVVIIVIFAIILYMIQEGRSEKEK